MPAPTNRDTWDIEVSTLAFMLANGKWMPHEIAHIERQLEDRKAQLQGGLGSPSQIYWTLEVQRRVDSFSRVRHDPIHGWMLDRWVEELDCWQPVGYIGTGGRLELQSIGENKGIHEDGKFAVVVDDVIRPDLIQFLREHDMQRPGYIEEKEAKAKAIRDENERLATEKVKAAVDSLTLKQIREFVEVEKAIQTGDTVTMHGETQRQFEAMTEAGKKAPPEPDAMNPGMHPLQHKRDYSKGEGEAYGK